MEQFIKRLKRHKGLFYISIILGLFLIVSSFYLIFMLMNVTGIKGIGGIVKIMLILGTILLLGLFILMNFKLLLKRKAKFSILFIVMFIYSLTNFYLASKIDFVLNRFSEMSSNTTNYETSLVTKKENNLNQISDLKDLPLGILNDENSVDGYILAKEIIKSEKLQNNELKTYDNYVALINALYSDEVKAIFLPSNYSVRFSSIESLANIKEETTVITTKAKSVKNKVTKKSTLNEPFAVLLMGVDSEYEDIKDSSFNGDSLMLLTFNPNTLNTTVLSIPRDTYVPIACFNGERKNKITHAAWYGQECMIETIQNFLDIKIDYYVKLNFKGLVKLVEALGGIDVEVPYSFCDQDSYRRWGEFAIYVEEGLQHLNGEQALALARNRHYPNDGSSDGAQMQLLCPDYDGGNRNDFTRGQNQQLVMKAILNKAKSIRSIDALEDLLSAVSVSLETNMTKQEILSLYNVAENILLRSKDEKAEELLGMQRLYLSGIDSYIYDYSSINDQGTELTLYNFVPYNGSIEDIKEEMKFNLELKDAYIEKNFAFDVDEEYEEKVIGKGYYRENNLLTLLPDFTGKDKNKAVEFCEEYGISLKINEVSSNSTKGIILSQSLHADMDVTFIDKNKGLTITVAKGSNTSSINCMSEENKDNTKDCAIPNFKGKSVSYVKDWFKKYNSYSLTIKYDGPDVDDEDTVITEQNITDDTLYSLLNNTFKLTYKKAE